MGFYDAFFGSDQSLYTAYAIIAAIIAICITILFTSTDIPIGSRLLMILFVIITLVPSIFLTLFEITCVVTGGTEPNNWWCYTFGWILAAFIIIYCIFVVIISIVSLITYNKAIDNVNNEEAKNKVDKKEANDIANHIMVTQKPIEKFYNTNLNNIIPGLNMDANNFNFFQKKQEGFIDEQQQYSQQEDFIDEHKKYQHHEGFIEEQKKQHERFIDEQQQQHQSQLNLPSQKITNPSPPKEAEKIAAFNNKIQNFSDYDGMLDGSVEDTLGHYPDIFNNK